MSSLKTLLPLLTSLAIPLTLNAVPALGAPYCGLIPSSSASAASATPTNTGCLAAAANSTGRIAATWYAGWEASKFPLQNVSWSKYTHVIYSFAITADDGTAQLEDSDASLIPSFVELAHENNVKAILSVGGWGGSRFFSSNVATEQNRTNFAQSLLGLVSQYGLDGLDFDWEFPNGDGIGCNTKDASDASNLLSLLQELRADPAGGNLTLSAATSIKPWTGPDGTPLTDVSQFSQVLDFISIMNYDVWGSWSSSLGVGPNAPLNDTCAPAADQQGSAVSALSAWTSASFPISQIVLGVASYGHSFSVTPTNAIDSSTGELKEAGYPAFDAANQPSGDSWDAQSGTGETDSCGNAVTTGGVFNFWGLMEGGFLSENGTAKEGILYRFDECSQTPYVYNSNTQVMVSYDDATSFSSKGKFIAENGLAGFSMWQAGGDSNDILLDSIRQAVSDNGGSGNC